MIAPRNRLLIWLAIIGLPFSILAGIFPSLTGTGLAAIAALIGLAVWDAARARRALDGIRLEAPPVARLALNKEGGIELRLRNGARRARLLRLALPLPAEFVSAWEELAVALPEGAEWSKFPWTCRAEKRGRFLLPEAYAGCVSPLGFWEARRRLPLQTEIRVYPSLQKEREGLLLLFRGGTGVHTQRQVGKGREFEKLRDYVPGDGSEDIHWKATARRRRPVTKIFQVERTQEVYVAFDTSRLSAREDAIECHISATQLIGLAAEQQGDLFGLLAFSDRVEKFVRARNGAAHYHTCRDAIYALQPRMVNPDFDEVCSFIRLRLRRRALVIILTALDDPLLAESFLRHVDMIARQHVVVVGIAKPAGIAPLFSDSGVSSPDELYGRLGGHLRWHNLEEVGRQLQRRGVKLVAFDSDRLGLRLVSEYLNIKQRQLL